MNNSCPALIYLFILIVMDFLQIALQTICLIVVKDNRNELGNTCICKIGLKGVSIPDPR